MVLINCAVAYYEIMWRNAPQNIFLFLPSLVLDNFSDIVVAQALNL